MKSHEYNLSLSDAGRLLVHMVVPMILFSALLRLGALAGLLPSPWPALDVDHTILTHQGKASQEANSAEILLIGDSSCLMDIAGGALGTSLSGKVASLNLGTFMDVGFEGYAAMLSRYARANPGRLRAVVVLVHPEMLRRVDTSSSQLGFLSDFYSGADFVEAASFGGQLRRFFSLDIFQDRFLSRLPIGLPKDYGRYYGFNLDLDRFMRDHGGSAVDPHQYRPGPGQGNPEYRFAPVLESGCLALKGAIPVPAKLVVGLAPVPESFAPPNYSARWQNLLDQWARTIQADAMLSNLPATMPDSDFASVLHLNEKGALSYTEILAQRLEPHLAR